MKRVSSLTLAVALLLSVIHIPTVSAQSEWILDDGDSGFTTSSTYNYYWGNHYTNFGGYNGDIAFEWAMEPSSSALWTFADLPAGQYTVSTTWPAQSYFTTSADYAVKSDGSTVATKTVNQRNTPSVDGWEPLGETITHTGGDLTVTLKYGRYKNGYLAADAVRVEAVVAETEPQIIRPTADQLTYTGGEGEGGDVSEIDVVVFYTQYALAEVSGITEMENVIQYAIDITNDSLNSSKVNAHVNLVHTQPITIPNEDESNISPFVFSQDPSIVASREEHNADIVMLIVGETFYTCGEATRAGSIVSPDGRSFEELTEEEIINDVKDDIKDSAFVAFVKRECITSQWTFPHEIGHLLGAGHNELALQMDNEPALEPWAKAHVNSTEKIATIMYNSPSQECGGGCGILDLFSNPNIAYEGIPLGIAGVADNVRTMNKMAPAVARFRDNSLRVKTARELPIGESGTEYSLQLTAVNVPVGSTLSWKMVSREGVPNTISLSKDGVLRGLLNTSMDVSFTIEVQESRFGSKHQKELRLRATGDAYYTNPICSADVDGDGILAPRDALLITNFININGAKPITDYTQDQHLALLRAGFLDTNGDNVIAPVDILRVANALNAGATCN